MKFFSGGIGRIADGGVIAEVRVYMLMHTSTCMLTHDVIIFIVWIDQSDYSIRDSLFLLWYLPGYLRNLPVENWKVNILKS